MPASGHPEPAPGLNRGQPTPHQRRPDPRFRACEGIQGWLGRRGASFETAALRLPQSLPRRRPGMRRFLNAIDNLRHGEERRRRVSNHARRRAAPGFRFETNSFIRSFAWATRKRNREPSIWFIKTASQGVSGAAWLPYLAEKQGWRGLFNLLAVPVSASPGDGGAR
jgi:hypothetical protein